MNSQNKHSKVRETGEIKKAKKAKEMRKSKKTGEVKEVGNTEDAFCEGKDYLTLKEMAQNTGCSYGMIKRDIDIGHLPAYRIGRKYFVSTAEAMAYIRNVRKKQDIIGYTIKDLMEMLPLSYAFLIELIKSKKLQAVKVGRQYVVPKEVFEGFMRENKVEI